MAQLLETLKEIISDFHEAAREKSIPRAVTIHPLPRKAAICIGVRRCGKSTLMLQYLEGLLAQGVSIQDVLWINFFDDRLHSLRKESLGLITEAYFSLFPEKKGAVTVYCFFDEIQSIVGWESFVDRIMRTDKVAVFLTGSSSQMLSKEIATQMRGRAITWELFPFSFREFLRAKGLEHSAALSTQRRLKIQNAFEEYREVGGFPAVFDLAEPLRVTVHQEYLQAILFRDLIERHDISHPKAVIDLVHWLLTNTACLYTVNALTGYLKALGHKIQKASVSEYLGWFEDAFFLFTVKIYDSSLARSNTNPKKIYCVDHAFVLSVASGLQKNTGRLLENMVFCELRRRHLQVFYYKTKSGREVDFVVQVKDARPLLVQVCENMADPSTRKREVAALTEAMGELKVAEGIIVTLHDDDTIKASVGAIRVVQAWRFLLDQ
jgi:predicted AAA+ superfamily ATPase